MGDEEPDGVIDGAAIGGLSPLDRFFIEEASAEVGITITTPDLNEAQEPEDTDMDGETDDGVRASASFGFVSVNLDGGGTIDATLALGLQDPGTVAADGRITLTELFDNIGDIETIVASPTLTGGGDITLDIDVTPDIPGVNVPEDGGHRDRDRQPGQPVHGRGARDRFHVPGFGRPDRVRQRRVRLRRHPRRAAGVVGLPRRVRGVRLPQRANPADQRQRQRPAGVRRPVPRRGQRVPARTPPGRCNCWKPSSRKPSVCPRTARRSGCRWT